MQNASVAENAAYETPKARDIIPNLQRLIDFARAHDMPVVWTRSDHSAPHRHPVEQVSRSTDRRRLPAPGTRASNFIPTLLSAEAGDYEVQKHKYDAFWETDLDAILRNNGVKTVIITGTATNICCDTTARSAFCRDYQVAFLSDATATFQDDMHEVTLKTMEMLFGRVMTTDETLAELEAATSELEMAT